MRAQKGTIRLNQVPSPSMLGFDVSDGTGWDSKDLHSSTPPSLPPEKRIAFLPASLLNAAFSSGYLMNLAFPVGEALLLKL